MRGASALGQVLARHPDARVRVIVIWEPVIESDVGPPTPSVRAPLADPRVVELWDGGRWLSPRALERAAARGDKVEPGDVAWDFIALFPPGAAWEEPFPDAVWQGEPVLESLAPVEKALADMAR